MTAWYDRAFGTWYPRLYPHRDGPEAERLVALLEPRLPRSGSFLDVACGAGRHVAVLRARGARVFGLDRSRDLLRQAPPAVRPVLVRGDMRALPFPAARFSAVLSLFTSFGYFATRADHEALLAELARVAAPGGVFVLDYADADRVRRTLVPRSARTVDGHAVVEERRLVDTADGERVVKSVAITSPRGEPVLAYEESVALYPPDTVADMLHAAGFTVRERFGDYAGAPHGPGADRVLFVSERVAA